MSQTRHDTYNTMMKMETFLLLLLLGGSARAFSSGAPSNACISLTPDHGGFPQPPPSPYTVDLSVFNMYGDGNNYYLPGQTYQCKQCVSILSKPQLCPTQWIYSAMIQCFEDFCSRRGLWQTTAPSRVPSLSQTLVPSLVPVLPLQWALCDCGVLAISIYTPIH